MKHLHFTFVNKLDFELFELFELFYFINITKYVEYYFNLLKQQTKLKHFVELQNYFPNKQSVKKFF